MFLYFSNLYTVTTRQSKYAWIRNYHVISCAVVFLSEHMYVATYRSSVGATGDGLDAAALCAAAALTV